MSRFETAICPAAAGLCIPVFTAAAVFSAVIKHVRHGIRGVSPQADRRRMIRQHQQAEIFPGGFQIIGYRFYDLSVDQLKTLDLLGKRALMSAFVRRFEMDIYELPAFFKRIHCGPGLTFKVGADRPRSALYIDGFQSGTHRPVDSVFLFKRRERRLSSLTPDPYRIRRIETFFYPGQIDRVILQKLVTFSHHFCKVFRPLSLRKIRSYSLFQYIMRRVMKRESFYQWMCSGAGPGETALQ